MARIRLKDNHELDPHIREHVQALDDKGVDTSNIRGFAHAQELFDSYFKFYGPAREGYSLEPELIELVRLKIARHNDCFT